MATTMVKGQLNPDMGIIMVIITDIIMVIIMVRDLLLQHPDMDTTHTMDTHTFTFTVTIKG